MPLVPIIVLSSLYRKFLESSASPNRGREIRRFQSRTLRWHNKKHERRQRSDLTSQLRGDTSFLCEKHESHVLFIFSVYNTVPLPIPCPSYGIISCHYITFHISSLYYVFASKIPPCFYINNIHLTTPADANCDLVGVVLTS